MKPAILLGFCAFLAAHQVHAAPVPGTTCRVLPADNVWNADISSLPVHARSAAWLTSMSASTAKLHPDFGGPYGIPYAVVSASHPDVFVDFLYADESDPGPYPFGSDIPIEGGVDADGDRHALMIDRDTCTLYELYTAFWNNGAPSAGSGAIFDLGSNALRPAGWTSADAAGLPIFPGLVRWDEIQAGSIDHAIRVTASRTDRSYLWPARHQAGAATDPSLPPMGARFRLKAGYDISGFSPQAKVVLTAMKRYGLIVADNGSNWFFQGATDAAWPDSFIAELKTVPASQFEAVDESSLMIDPNSGQAAGGTTPSPGASVSPTSVAYGDVAVGSTSTRTVTVTSTGTASLHVASATVSGTDFSKVTDGCSGQTLAPGGSCAVSVRFAPTAAASRSGQLVVTDDAAGSPRGVALSGRGVTTSAGIGVSPTSIAWGRWTVGNTSTTHTVTVTSTGAATLTIGTVAFGGANPGDFIKPSDTCTGKSLAPGATCAVKVRFRPTARGFRSAQLLIPSNAPGSPSVVNVSGTGR